jgi:hypothetical protein
MGPQLGKSFFKKLTLKYIFFSKTRRPISIKLDSNYPCMKEIQVSSDKKTYPHQRGDNHKNATIGWGHLKIFLSRTSDPENRRFT